MKCILELSSRTYIHVYIFGGLVSLLTATMISVMGCSSEEYTGASSPPDPGYVEYTGSTAPTKVTARNAIGILRDILNSTATYSDISLQVASLMDDQTSCSSGGYTEEIVQDSGLMYPPIKLRFTNCELGGIRLHYNANYYLESSYPQYKISYLDFIGLSVYECKDIIGVCSYDEVIVHSLISGSMTKYKSLSGYEEQTTVALNFNVDDYENDKLLKFQDMNVVYTIGDIYDRDSQLMLSISGSPARYYDSEDGYVEIKTITPLIPYASLTTYFGDQGELLVTGDNSTIRFIPKNSNYFNIQIDLDGDGITDLDRDVIYDAIESTAYVDLEPVESRWYP